MGAFHEEKVRDSQKRARARRRNELIKDDMLASTPERRGPSARMRCNGNSDLKLGERLAVKLAHNFGAVSKAGEAVGFVEKLPAAVLRSASESQVVEATVCRKHTFGTGFDIQFELPKVLK